MASYIPLLRLFTNPSIALPHASVSSFADLPVPLSRAFGPSDDAASTGLQNSPTKKVDIRAVVLDKDNCFAADGTVVVHPPYEAKFRELRESLPEGSIVIVSNSGALRRSKELQEKLSAATKLPLLTTTLKKPACGPEVLKWFKDKHDLHIERPDQIVVIGDRIATDVMLANLIGARSIWVRNGVDGGGTLASLERSLVSWLTRKGYQAPTPRSVFEGE